MNTPIAPYLFKYFKTNHFLVWLLLFLFGLSAVKYLRMPKLPSTKTMLFLILALGLLLRLARLGFSAHQPQMVWNDKHMPEYDINNINAIELTQGIWFHDITGLPTTRRPIGYPVLLGLLYKLFGVHVEIVWIAHLCLYVATAYLIFLITQLAFSERIALLATFIFSIYPISVYSVKLIT